MYYCICITIYIVRKFGDIVVWSKEYQCWACQIFHNTESQVQHPRECHFKQSLTAKSSGYIACPLKYDIGTMVFAVYCKGSPLYPMLWSISQACSLTSLLGLKLVIGRLTDTSVSKTAIACIISKLWLSLLGIRFILKSSSGENPVISAN